MRGKVLVRYWGEVINDRGNHHDQVKADQKERINDEQADKSTAQLDEE